MKTFLSCAVVATALFLDFGAAAAESLAGSPWTVGTPIVTYWCGPALTDAVARQMAEGGWNLVWCGEGELDTAHRHGLRAQLTHPLLNPASLDDSARREELDALIARVRRHPALYAYFLTDEPNAAQFPALGRLVAHLRELDPGHLAYINLFPTYASNEQLGNSGDPVTAYLAHLGQFVAKVKPGLISYDHYQFAVAGDNPDYFLNLSLIRRAALEAGLPFLNIVQAATWTPSMRVPNADEMRYLVFTTLAYGAQGISYYIYQCPNHQGGFAHADGTPTALYEPMKTLNREFVAVARELQPLVSINVYHAGMKPPGAVWLPEDAPFAFDPPVPVQDFQPRQRATGLLLGYFGPKRDSAATHVLVVNLDYQATVSARLRGPGALDRFEPVTSRWTAVDQNPCEIRLAGGGGRLLRVRR